MSVMPGCGFARRCCCILLIGCTLCLLLCVQSSVGQQKFCGKTLTDAMDLLCLNGYNDKISSSGRSRRSVNALQMDFNVESKNFPPSPSSSSLPSSSSSSDLSYPVYDYAGLNPFWINIYANVLAKTRRRRGGVYDECCRKSCSYTELAAYCRPV